MTNCKSLLLFSLLIGFLNISFSQVPHKCAMHIDTINRCATTKAMQEEIAKNPSYKDVLVQNEQTIEAWINANFNTLNHTEQILTIPVVVHVVYRTADENISDNRIYEQLQILNQDYRNQNPDGANVPAPFQMYRGDAKVEFCLAQRTPDNLPTTGIERRQTTAFSFSTNLNSPVKFYSQGGLDAWNTTQYLNIWVCALSSNYLGFAQFPGGNPLTDGVVIDYRYFGISGAIAPYNKGRTLVHEVGHYFNLYHIWGDDENATNTCSGTDYCSDTPNQQYENYGTPSYPLIDDCSPSAPGIMFMNYMDYVDDAAMIMFTNDQVLRVQACVNTLRLGLMNSNGCQPIGVSELLNDDNFLLWPNPAHTSVEIAGFAYNQKEVTVEIHDIAGKLLMQLCKAHLNEKFKVDIGNLYDGIYLLTIKSGNQRITKRLVVQNNATIHK